MFKDCCNCSWGSWHYLIPETLQTDSIGLTGVQGGQWDSQGGLGAQGTEIGHQGVPIFQRAELHRQFWLCSAIPGGACSPIWVLAVFGICVVYWPGDMMSPLCKGSCGVWGLQWDGQYCFAVLGKQAVSTGTDFGF